MQTMTQPSITIRLKKSLRAFVALIGLAAALELATAEPSQPVNPPCAPFSGTFYFTLLEFGDGGATAHGEGIVKDGDEVIATFAADYFLDQQGNGVVQATASHTITFLDGSGSLVTSDEIRLLDGRANSRLYIIGGSGDFEGATGLLHTHGTIAAGIDFKGQVCVP